MAKLTIKNYRCFADESPLLVELVPGFSAYVGPNNSGKSTVLKFFYEFRNLLGSLRIEDTLGQYARGQPVPVNALGVEDPVEVLHNGNDRPLTIQIDFPSTQRHQLTRVVFRCDRADPASVTPELYCDGDHIKIKTAVQQGTTWVFTKETGQEAALDVSSAITFGAMIQKAMYVGPFRNAIAQGGGPYFDLEIGGSFIQRWDAMKTGGVRQDNVAAQRVAQEIAAIFGYQQIEVNVTSGNNELQVIADRNPYRLRELGAGIAQFVVVLGNVAYKKPSYLLIDEPELNLHPSLQVDFLTTLASYAAEGVAFATHSIGLARTTGERIYACHREGSRAIVHPFEQIANLTEFAGELSFSAFHELGFDTILLVEGVTDVKTVQQFLRLYHADHKVVLLPLGGSQMINSGREGELRELKRLTSKVAVLIDSEREVSGAALSPERQAFVRDCEALGYRVHVTNWRAMENYFSQQAIRRAKGPQHNALAPYDALATVANGWDKADNWRIAREMTVDELDATDIGPFLAQFA